jgi:hypothetical protein
MKKLVISLILSFSVLTMFSQRLRVEWEKTYGGEQDDVANCIIETSEGGYMLCGTTESMGDGSEDIYVLKLSNTGEIIWEKNYGGEGKEIGNEIIESVEGGYAIAGATSTDSKGKLDYYLVKIDQSGKVKWKELFGGQKDDEATKIIQIHDSSYVIGGYTRSRGNGYSDIWLINTKGNGARPNFRKNFGGDRRDELVDIVQKPDSNLLILGNTQTPGVNGFDALIYTMEWDRGRYLVKQSAGWEEYDNTSGIVQVGMDMVIGGSTMLNTKGDFYDFYIFKLDFNYRPEWDIQIWWKKRGQGGSNYSIK